MVRFVFEILYRLPGTCGADRVSHFGRVLLMPLSFEQHAAIRDHQRPQNFFAIVD
jgi:hypothetical protein